MANEIPTPQVSAPASNPVALMRALGNPLRWDVLRRLALDGPQSVNDLAAKADRSQDSMSRHMTLLWKAGAVVVVPPPDGDGRKVFFALPPGRLREGAGGKEIDYGACVLRLS